MRLKSWGIEYSVSSSKIGGTCPLHINARVCRVGGWRRHRCAIQSRTRATSATTFIIGCAFVAYSCRHPSVHSPPSSRVRYVRHSMNRAADELTVFCTLHFLVPHYGATFSSSEINYHDNHGLPERKYGRLRNYYYPAAPVHLCPCRVAMPDDEVGRGESYRMMCAARRNVGSAARAVIGHTTALCSHMYRLSGSLPADERQCRLRSSAAPHQFRLQNFTCARRNAPSHAPLARVRRVATFFPRDFLRRSCTV